jgi:hypothetical protein
MPPGTQVSLGNRRYPAGMSTSPVSPEDIRAAAETYEELGPEYHDAVVAAFVDKVEREVAARVEARLAEERRAQAARRRRGMAGRARRGMEAGGRREIAARPRGGTLVKSIAVGAAAGALVAFLGFNHTEPAPGGSARPSYIGNAPRGQARLVPAQLLPAFRDRIRSAPTRVSAQP